ncbi:MAG: agmatinase [Planctomycetes bacterium]|nr:agmatinase [Planctomycetota bacterium]
MVPMNGNFMNLSGVLADKALARYAVLPIPYEATVSYKTGTAGGPAAIIEASTQVEQFDEELKGEFFQAGIATYPAVEPAGDPAGELEKVYQAARAIMKEGKFLLTLGGEHSITTSLVRAAIKQHGPLSVLQIDAHADLRDAYDGTKHSHACVMRRVLEMGCKISQVGIRNFSRAELEECPKQAAAFITPEIVETDLRWIDRAITPLGPKVYLTIDVDGFDPACVPGTGTPEPGGLTWRQVAALVRRLCERRQVVAADIVELAPIPGMHAGDFLCARLAYKIIAYTQLRKAAVKTERKRK